MERIIISLMYKGGCLIVNLCFKILRLWNFTFTFLNITF
jgi:hypothetical protein